jgi:uncharacterized LabA/DUF88 family protein
MNRVAVMVDAGYFFAAGSAVVGGSAKQKRQQVSLDERATCDSLKQLANDVSHGAPLLRIYWYDGASRKIGPTAEHERLAHCNDVKLRLGIVNDAGKQKGVDSLIVTDLVELARNRAITDVVLMSGDEDVRIGVVLAQSFGVRVHLAGIQPARCTQSTQLLQEADTCVEWGCSELRGLISIRADECRTATLPIEPLSAEAAELPQIDVVVAEMLETLRSQESLEIDQYMAAYKDSLPVEFDRKFQTRLRRALGRGLKASEREYARNQFRRCFRRR